MKPVNVICRMLKVLIFTAVTLSALRAQANDSSQIDWSFNGFGTLGVVHSDYDQADFVSSALVRPNGVGVSRSWGIDPDTNLGLQVTAAFTPRLTAVVQVISQQRYDNTYKPTLEWANLKYEITPEWSIRVGRVVLPTFLTSESQAVGYVNPFVRTPGEVPVQLPVTNNDGVDLSYRFNVGDVSNRLQAIYGENESKIPDGSSLKNTGVRAATLTTESGPTTVHVSYQRMRYSVAVESVPNGEKFAFTCFELGVEYDPGGWYVTGELFNTRDELIGHTQAWYLGGGYRIAKFTPYLVISKIKQTTVGSFGQSPIFDQKTSAAGIRWDFMKNIDAKLQYQRINIDSGIIPTSFVNFQPGLSAGDRAHVISGTIDFVW